MYDNAADKQQPKANVRKLNMTAFWDTATCGLTEVDQCFRVAYCLHHQFNEMP
jgi:hypothetical protein